MAVQRQPNEEDLRRLERALTKKGITVHFLPVDSTNMRVTVKQAPIGDYTELYEACIRALFRLEQLTGTLVNIEGIPRPKCLQFVLIQRFGGLE